jgi:5-methyltetrahydropteroyltriglutamate--homocysteine methyltransferase
MKRSTDHILTTHVGSMPRPADLAAMDPKPGQPFDAAAYAARLRSATQEIVRKQVDVGIDVINDGELYKPSWSGYIRSRLAGFDNVPIPPEAVGFSMVGSEAEEFGGYYSERSTGQGGIGGGGLGAPGGPGERSRGAGNPYATSPTTMLACTGPVSYIGQAEIARDVENAKAAVAGVNVADVFMASVGPDNIGYQPGVNQYYPTEEEYIAANAKALRTEYQAIVDAGFILQIDTPVQKFKALKLELPEFRRRFEALTEIMNDALQGIPSSQVRLHICYGGGRGPHKGDILLDQYVDLVFKINADAVSFDQNVRHEHEWVMWKERKLPEGKILIPGVVAHTTDVIEHPELVRQRIVRLANLVGRENVIAGTDCGLGGRVHPDVVWAKFGSQVEGARLATKELWGK